MKAQPQLSVRDVAERYGITAACVTRSVKRGHLPSPDLYVTHKGGAPRPRWYKSTIDNHQYLGGTAGSPGRPQKSGGQQ